VAQHAVPERERTTTSGNRWSARSKCRLRLFHEGDGRFDGAVYQHICNRMRQYRRRCGQRSAYRAGGHADRTAIVREAVVMVAGLAAIGLLNDCNERVTLVAANHVDMTEGQHKVQRQRNQRKPRTEPDMVTKQTHHDAFKMPPQPAGLFWPTIDLSRRAGRVNRNPATVWPVSRFRDSGVANRPQPSAAPTSTQISRSDFRMKRSLPKLAHLRHSGLHRAMSALWGNPENICSD